MFSSRFQFPEPVNDSRLLRNSCRLKLDFMAACLSDDDAPGTVYVSYIVEGDVKFSPGESLAEILAIVDGFRAAQVAKGGDHEANS